VKVLMVTTDFTPKPFGGIGRHVGELVEALRNIGVKVTVVLPHREENLDPGADAVQTPPVGPQVNAAELTGNLFSLHHNNIGLAAVGGRLVGREHFDIVHGHEFFAGLATTTLARVAGARSILSKHFVTRNGPPAWQKEPAYPYAVDMERWSVQTADRLIAVSEGLASSIREIDADAASRCAVIHNGTNIADWPSAEATTTLRERYCRPGELLLLAVGRLTYQKGCDIAVQALAQMDRPARLVFVGVGPQQEELVALSRQLGVQDRVQFVGYVEGAPLADLYRASDVVIAASRHEGFGIVVAEALSLGRPVAAARIEGITEQITHGVNGLLFEKENAAELAQCLRQLFDEPGRREEWGREAARLARTRYAWEHIARQTVEQYEIALRLPARS